MGADLGRERGGPGVDLHLHAAGELMAAEPILIAEDNERNYRKLVRDVLRFKSYQRIEVETAQGRELHP